MATTNVGDRFWPKVSKAPHPQGCWEWIGTCSRHGYGTMWQDGRLRLAHRLSHELSIGPIPEGLLVCHSCDNRKCVNPAHLWAGTAKQNTADMLAKGRRVPKEDRPRGSAVWASRLTEKAVSKILALHARGGVPQKELARRFGVSGQTISRVVLRRGWTHVPAAPVNMHRTEPPMQNLYPTVPPVPANKNFFRVSLHVSNRALLAEVKQLVLEREAIALSDTSAVQRALSEMRTKLLRAKKGK